MVYRPQGHLVLPPHPVLALEIDTTAPDLLCGCLGGLSLGPYACKVHTLPTRKNFLNLEYIFWQSKDSFRWAKGWSNQKLPNTLCDARAHWCLLLEIGGIPKSSSVGSALIMSFPLPILWLHSLDWECEHDTGTHLLSHVLFISLTSNSSKYHRLKVESLTVYL